LDIFLFYGMKSLFFCVLFLFRFLIVIFFRLEEKKKFLNYETIKVQFITMNANSLVHLQRLLKQCKSVYMLTRLYLQYKLGKSLYHILMATCSIGFFALIVKIAKKLMRRKSQAKITKSKKDNSLTTSKTPGLNAQFYKEAKFLMKIMFPKLLCKQTGFLVTHTLTLISRTFLSLIVAKLEALLVKNIVLNNPRQFFKYLSLWILIAIPATTCNSLIRFLESKLELELKTHLVKKAVTDYFQDRVYYQIALKQNENLQIDQNLSDDIEKLSHLFVHLYSQLTKPLLDITISTTTLITMGNLAQFLVS
jgi:ABC-type uncharacterized transport system fused permease/ATPase subunit